MKKILIILVIGLISCEKDAPTPIVVSNRPQQNQIITPAPVTITKIKPFFVGVRLIVVLNRHPTKAITAVYIDRVLQNFDYPIIGNRGYQFRNRSRIDPNSVITIMFSGSGKFNYFDVWRFDSYNNVIPNYASRINVAIDSTRALATNKDLSASITFQDQFSIISN